MPANVRPSPASPGDGTHPDDLPYAQAWADAMVVTPTGWYVDAQVFRVRFAALRKSGMPVAGDDPVLTPSSPEQEPLKEPPDTG